MPSRWLIAVIRTTRPRQWLKNLLVFAAPLAGTSSGRQNGFAYALVAAVAFGLASAAVYFANDVADAVRDRRHPRKRNRPVASGDLPKKHALILGGTCALMSIVAGLMIAEPLLVACAVTYLAISFLYSAGLKHLPVIEMLSVASGFLLRVLGGAAATHVPPSVWFLLVCSFGALGVAVAKRYTELVSTGIAAVKHRPAMRWYSPAGLRVSQYLADVAMMIAYLLWASGEHGSTRIWHNASGVPRSWEALAANLWARASICRSSPMVTSCGLCTLGGGKYVTFGT
jgi:decaprenyl-phosphate phosphoribosyltransferase